MWQPPLRAAAEPNVAAGRREAASRLHLGCISATSRPHPTKADLWPIVHAVPTPEGQALARELLRDLLAEAENPALPAAAEEASQGPRARATRLAEAATALLETPEQEGWRLKLEGVAREIDAGFDPSALPGSLAELRPRIVAALTAPAETTSAPDPPASPA